MDIARIAKDFREVPAPKSCGDIHHRCHLDKCKEVPTQYITLGSVTIFLCPDHFRQFTRELAYPGILAKEQESSREPTPQSTS